MEKKDKITKKFSFLIYGIALLIGFIVFLFTKSEMIGLFIGMLPSIFFIFYSVLSDKDREWSVFFGVWDAIGLFLVIFLGRNLYFLYGYLFYQIFGG